MSRGLRHALLCTLCLGSGVALADNSLHFGPPYIVTGGFSRPFGVGVDTTHDRLLVADSGNRRFRWTTIADLTGAYTFTEQGFVADANAADALVGPEGIAADAQGNVYVVNTFRNEVQQYQWNGGNYQFNAAFCASNAQSVDGTPIALPRDVAVGADGKVYLLDSGNHRILVADGPAATSWSVRVSDASWRNPYGLAVDANGVLFVADTGNHRIVKIDGAVATPFGHFGTDLGEYRFPRDVAVDQHGRIYVADTFNHRIQVLGADLHPLITLGQAPAVGTIDKVVIDGSDRIFAIDSDRNQVLAYLGGSTPPPFDPYFRDFVGDDGSEPSNAAFQIASPDILVRYAPDVDLQQAATNGLESIAFQQPRFEQDNWVYIALRNRGTQPAAENFVRLYFYDPSGPKTFPAEWKTDGFYTAYASPTSNTPGNTFHAPLVAPGGVVVLGPLLWHPPAPESTIAHDGVMRLAARVSNPYDEPPTGTSTTMARDSNSVTERRVLVMRGPFTTGDQNTLVLRTHYPDVATPTDEIDVTARATLAAAWMNEVSYGTAPVNIAVKGPVSLPQPRAHYAAGGNTVLVEMVEDALNALMATDAHGLDGPTPGTNIGRVILVTNDFGNHADWATTGAWPYTVAGKTRFITASVQAADNADPMYAHGLAHQLNLIDLYAHDGVTFPKPYADGWDNMAKPFNDAHPLVWSKEQAFWVSGKNAKIVFVPRPAAGTTWNNGGAPIKVHVQETAAADQIVGVAFGLTNGVTSFEDEGAFYYVEARLKGASGAMAAIPASGVLMYYANKAIPQGQGPVIVRDHVVGGTLDDAVIPIGASEAPGGTGISVLVQTGTDGADYNLSVQYNPPATDYDVYMHEGSPPWESPDIWIDNKQDGFDEDNARTPADRGNLGIAGEPNRVYAKVFNAGPADAFDAEVNFAFSEPYHTVGDTPEFIEFKSVFLDRVKPNEPKTPFVTWTPQTGVEPHTCARVELRRLFDDTNAANNVAQRNLQIDHSVHGSPYTPVEFHFTVDNPDATTKPVYFRAEGVPTGWTWSFAPKKVLLAPHARGEGLLKLLPPNTAPDCTTHKIYVTAWLPRGDTLIRLGGTTVNVDLQQKTAIKQRTTLAECTKDDRERLRREGDKTGRQCARIVTRGCTVPPRPNQEIVVRYAGPDGEPIYHTVMTDANGCYEDFNVTVDGGPWTADAEFQGTQCYGPAGDKGTVTVPLPQKPPRDPPGIDPDRRVCLGNVAGEAKGLLERLRDQNAKARECRDRIVSRVALVKVRLDSPQAELPEALKQGELELQLRMILDQDQHDQGLLRGRFRWRGERFEAIGTVIGQRFLAGADQWRWKMELTGTVTEGEHYGARLRLAFGVESKQLEEGKPLPLSGTVRGVIESTCGASRELLLRRIEMARALLARALEEPCKDGLPCLFDLARTGKGELRLDQTAQERCEKPDCTTRKTWEALSVKLPASNDGASKQFKLGDAELTVPSWITVMRDTQSAAEQQGTARLKFADGSVAEGVLVGLAKVAEASPAPGAVPTHADDAYRSSERRSAPPLLRAVQSEAQFQGRVTEGPLKGMYLSMAVELREEPSARRRRGVEAQLRGWLVRGCLGQQPDRDDDKDDTPPPPPTTGPGTTPRPRLKLELDPREYRRLEDLPENLVAVMRRAAGNHWDDQEKDRLRLADHRFGEVDTDHDGKVNQQEFARQFPDREHSRDLVGKQWFDKLDVNHDGFVDQKESAQRWQRLAAIDRDGDKRVSRAEMLASVSEAADPAWRKADADKNGMLDETEFVLWWRTLPSAKINHSPP